MKTQPGYVSIDFYSFLLFVNSPIFTMRLFIFLLFSFKVLLKIIVRGLLIKMNF